MTVEEYRETMVGYAQVGVVALIAVGTVLATIAAATFVAVAYRKR